MALLLAACLGQALAESGGGLQKHWSHPLPPQGKAPPGWTKLEKSLFPDQCGVCHPAQKNAWQNSRHARATGPGFEGQALKMIHAADPKKTGTYFMCTRCHAPLHEQRALLRTGQPNPQFSPRLYDTGVSCAACHVRSHQRHGPPGRTPPMAKPPHGGYTAHTFFQKSDFCATCHQFRPKTQKQFLAQSLKGKLFENTFEEWKKSPFAARGVPCQGCHMPDRQHLFRGIHHPDMVRRGLKITPGPLKADTDGKQRWRVVVKSQWVGHLFPTYTTPQVFVSFYQTDGRGKMLPTTRVRFRIGWHVATSLKQEYADKRMKPGEARAYQYTFRPHPNAKRVVAQLWVDPDELYRRVFRKALAATQPPATQAAYQKALQDADNNRFTVWRKSLLLEK